MEGFPKAQTRSVTPQRSHSIRGLRETWNPRPDFSLGSHTSCLQVTPFPGPGAPLGLLSGVTSPLPSGPRSPAGPEEAGLPACDLGKGQE